MNHFCHAKGCGNRVPPALFMCKPHWMLLPPAARAAIWKNYRPGQEIDKNPTAEYLRVTDKAIAWLEEQRIAKLAERQLKQNRSVK